MTEETTEMASGRIAIGIDVGGSGIKAAVVDVEAGRLRSERLRVATPNPSTPDAVAAATRMAPAILPSISHRPAGRDAPALNCVVMIVGPHIAHFQERLH